jgi:hypothetical protein
VDADLPGTRASVEVFAPRPAQPLVVPAAHTAGLFLMLRASEALLYPHPFARTEVDYWGARYAEAFTRWPVFYPDRPVFEWDNDPWTINALGHALLGSELYYRPRRCGVSPLGSLAFATGATVVWEYGFEANGVRPSALDLFYTPIAGLVLGEGRYWGVRLARGIRDRTLRGVVTVILDPLGEFERALGAPC